MQPQQRLVLGLGKFITGGKITAFIARCLSPIVLSFPSEATVAFTTWSLSDTARKSSLDIFYCVPYQSRLSWYTQPWKFPSDVCFLAPSTSSKPPSSPYCVTSFTIPVPHSRGQCLPAFLRPAFLLRSLSWVLAASRLPH